MATQPNSLFILFFLNLSFSLINLTQSAERCNPNDKKALLEIKAQMGPKSSFFSAWKPNTDCCTWDLVSVMCDKHTNRIKYLTIGRTAELSGPIPPAVGRLTSLISLWLIELPGLTGPIPSFLSNLINLEDLQIFRTNLTGPIPEFLSRLNKMTTLDLSENRLSGSIPGSLSLLTNLVKLILSNNQLTGSIPESFSSFKDLFFRAQENQLSGPIPRSLNQTGFNWLDLGSNQLTGDASFLFGRNKILFYIDLMNNALSFDFSKLEFSYKLHYIDVSHNMIYGSLPDQLAELHLYEFNVSYNQLCGPIPAGEWVARVTRNKAVGFDHNKCLCGAPLEACK